MPQKIIFEPIGTIHSPYKDIEGMPIQPTGAKGVKGTLEIDHKYVSGLKDLDGFSHMIILYHFHLSEGYSLEVEPFLDKKKRGLFSTRAPKRPNPIGLSIVKLLNIHDNIVEIEDVDIVDGTPLLDIKPYVPDFDHRDVKSIGWLSSNSNKVSEKRSDERFK